MKRIKLALATLLLALASTVSAQITEVGLASFYADKFDGRMTASGETFSQKKMTAAHRTLPFGTVVRVTNLDNNLSVDVTINDRGPFVGGHYNFVCFLAIKIRLPLVRERFIM